MMSVGGAAAKVLGWCRYFNVAVGGIGAAMSFGGIKDALDQGNVPLFCGGRLVD